MGEDVLLTSVGWANSYYMANEPYVDEWGVGWTAHPYQTPFGIGHYTETASHLQASPADQGQRSVVE